MPPGLEPKSGSVSPKQPIASPAAIRGSQVCFCSSLPNFQIANMASDPCTDTMLRTPESPASSSRQASPYDDGVGAGAAVALQVHAEQPERAGLAQQAEVDLAALVPVGDVRPDPLGRRTRARLAWMSRSSSVSRWSTPSSSSGPDAGHRDDPFPASVAWRPSRSRPRPAARARRPAPAGRSCPRWPPGAIGPAKPALDQRGDHALADPAGAPGLVDHQHPAGRRAAASTSATGSGASQRRSSTSAPMPCVGQPARPPAGSSARRCRR